MSECKTTVNVPIERFKELEKIEDAVKNGETIAYLKEYDYEINDYKEKFYFSDDAHWKLDECLTNKVSSEVKYRYKQDNPSIVKKATNAIKNMFIRDI